MKKSKKIDIIFILYIFIGTIYFMIKSFLDGSFDITAPTLEMIKTATIEQLFLWFLFGICIFILLFIMSFILCIFQNFLIVAIYIGYKISIRSHHKNKLDKNDFNYNSYYRDIIKNYSVGELSYIDNFNIDRNTVSATILSLEQKKKIKIGENITVIDNTCDNLKENEKYILNKINSNNFKNIDLDKFQEIIIKDCLENNLLEKRVDIKNNNKKFIIKYIFTLIILVFLNIILSNFLYNKQVNNFLFILAIFMFLLVGITAFLFFAAPIIIISFYNRYHTLNRLDPYIRSKKAKKINKNLEGLKKFINDFTLLDEKKLEEFKLWEEYLIYTVMFGKNKDIIDKINSKFN